MKISFRCSYENLVVFCVCVLLLLLLRIWGMLLGRRWKWPSVRLNACRTFSGRRRFYPAHFFFFSLCSSLVFPPSVTQDFAYVYKTEATDWLSFFFSSTDCMWRYYEKLSRRKTAGEMLHARTFLFFIFFFFELIPRENSYRMSWCNGVGIPTIRSWKMSLAPFIKGSSNNQTHEIIKETKQQLNRLECFT